MMESDIPDPAAVRHAQAVAIDFETANADRASACAIGIAWISGDEVTHVAHRLIRPDPCQFDSRNVGIHGIRPKDVADKPAFPQIWRELYPAIAGKLLFAHNAAFDLSVLRAVLSQYAIPWPTLNYLCTVKIAQEVWPELANHKLPTVAGWLGIPLSHHDASSDAVACAKVALGAVEVCEATGVLDVHTPLGISMGSLERHGYLPCSSPPKRRL